MRRRSEWGQVIVEYAIVFPILLLLTLVIIQLAHLFIAKQVVSYAAFCAARAALVGEDHEAAARMTCSLIAGPAGAAGSTIDLPGWGPLRGSDASARKTRATELADVTTEYPATTVEVMHDFELRVPIANQLAYSLGDVFLGSEDLVYVAGAPHICIRSRCTLSRPWQE